MNRSEKIKLLQDIKSGKRTIGSLQKTLYRRPPGILALEKEKGIYNVCGKIMSRKELQQFADSFDKPQRMIIITRRRFRNDDAEKADKADRIVILKHPEWPNPEGDEDFNTVINDK